MSRITPSANPPYELIKKLELDKEILADQEGDGGPAEPTKPKYRVT